MDVLLIWVEQTWTARGPEPVDAFVELGADRTLVRLGHDPDDELPALGELDSTAKDKLAGHLVGRKVSIALEAHRIHVVTIELPRASRRFVERAVPYQMAQISPIVAESLLFAVLHEPWEGADLISVRVALVHRSDVETCAAHWAALGLPPARIGFAAHGARELQATFLAPAGTPKSVRHRARLSTLVAGMLFLLLAGPPIAGAMFTGMEYRVRRETAELRRRLEPKLEAGRLARDAQQVGRLVEPTLAALTPETYLAELARTLPADAWVSRFEYQPDRVAVHLRGDGAPHALEAMQITPSLASARVVSGTQGTGPDVVIAVIEPGLRQQR